jgi:glycosyltransferase involved in cell wall biosynthesis
MKLVQLNKNDLAGGAARAAYRLHKGLQRAGHDSVMVVETRAGDDPSVISFQKPMDTPSLLRRGLRHVWIDRDLRRHRSTRPAGYELFSHDRSPYGATLLDQIPACDVINLHWIPGLVDNQTFFSRVPQRTPVVWTLHDLNPLTGGCHYGLGCERYLEHCGSCPQLGSSEPGDLSSEIWARKQRLFSTVPASRLRIVAPSQWLAHEAKDSPILGRFPVQVIPYGLDLAEFAPRDRGKVRDLLGIPRTAKVLLFVAEEISNQRKGFTLLLEALASCNGSVPNLLLVSLGQKRPDVEVRLPWVHVGFINNDRFLSMVYSAADLFVITSLQDNLPNTVLESMACGIPVVGTKVGGIPDMVRNGVNGVTVNVNDVGALTGAISGLLNCAPRRQEMGENARRIAEDEYGQELQAQRYVELYAELVRDQEHAIRGH